MKLKLYKEIRNYTIKFMSGICITTMLMNADGASSKMQKVLAPASRPNTLEELLPESDKNKKMDANLLGYLDCADITQEYVEDVTVSHILANGKEQVVYYIINRDDNNNRIFCDIETYATVLYSKGNDNYTKLYGTEYIEGDIVWLSSACLEDYFKTKTGKELNMYSVRTEGDVVKIKRLLDTGNTFYMELSIEQQEVVQQAIDEGRVKPASPDYSLDDYTTSKIKTR